MTTASKYNQSLIDLAIQYTGSAETVFEILAANEGLELTDELSPGQEIVIPDEAVDATNTIVTNYFVTNNIILATAIREESNENELGALTDSEGSIGDDAGEIFG